MKAILITRTSISSRHLVRRSSNARKPERQLRLGQDVTAGFVAVVAGLTVSACSSGHRHGPTATEQSSVSQAVIDFLVPRNGLAFATGQATMSGFVTAVTVKATDACLRTDGFPALPPQPTLGMAGSAQLPNLTLITSQKGFGIDTGVKVEDPTKGMTAAQKTAYAHAATRCAPKLPPMAFNSAAARSLVGDWMGGVLSLIASSPAVVAANRAGAQCSRLTAFPATSYEKEENEVISDALGADSQNGASAERRVEARGASVFVRCFAGAVETVDRLLSTRIRSFLAAHALVIRLIQKRTVAQVMALSKKYDVRLSVVRPRKRG